MLCATAWGAGERQQELPSLSSACSRGLFPNLEPEQIQTTMAFWVNSFGVPNSICRSGGTAVLGDPEAWRRAAEQNSFMLGILNMPDFLELEADGFLDPCFVVLDSNGAGSELILLAHREGLVRSLADLKDRELVFVNDSFRGIARVWVDALLAEGGLEAQETFFGGIVEKKNTNAALLPVLLKESGACVVTRDDFETLKELSPQLERKLLPIAVSPNYVSTVICLRRGCDPDLAGRLNSALAGMHEDVVGKQLLMAFRIGGFQPFEPGCIEPVRELFGNEPKLLEGQ